MNIQTHNMSYYDNYVGSMDIMQLGQFDSKQDDDARVTYAVRLFEVYPQTIGSYDMDFATDNSLNQNSANLHRISPLRGMSCLNFTSYAETLSENLNKMLDSSTS